MHDLNKQPARGKGRRGHDRRRCCSPSSRDPETLLDAARRARDAGWRGLDAHVPFAIDGLAEALGLAAAAHPPGHADRRPRQRRLRLCAAMVQRGAGLPAQFRRAAAAQLAGLPDPELRGRHPRRDPGRHRRLSWSPPACHGCTIRPSPRRVSTRASQDRFFLAVADPARRCGAARGGARGTSARCRSGRWADARRRCCCCCRWPLRACRQEMAQQRRYDTYEPSPLWPDGSAARPLPAGVVARGDLARDAAMVDPPEVDAGAAGARAGTLRHLLRALPRAGGRRRRHDPPPRLPPPAELPHRRGCGPRRRLPLRRHHQGLWRHVRLCGAGGARRPLGHHRLYPRAAALPRRRSWPRCPTRGSSCHDRAGLAARPCRAAGPGRARRRRRLLAVWGCCRTRLALAGWLAGLVFWLGIALGAYALLALHALTGGRWLAPLLPGAGAGGGHACRSSPCWRCRCCSTPPRSGPGSRIPAVVPRAEVVQLVPEPARLRPARRAGAGRLVGLRPAAGRRRRAPASGRRPGVDLPRGRRHHPRRRLDSVARAALPLHRLRRLASA